MFIDITPRIVHGGAKLVVYCSHTELILSTHSLLVACVKGHAPAKRHCTFTNQRRWFALVLSNQTGLLHKWNSLMNRDLQKTGGMRTILRIATTLVIITTPASSSWCRENDLCGKGKGSSNVRIPSDHFRLS
jgi:hypothetical protein